jgi:hypothetical protein
MNKAFTKSKELILDENFKIVPDSDNGVILIFTEERKREKEIKSIDGKKVKSGTVEIFVFEDKYCYPRIAQALRKYAELSTNHKFDTLALANEAVYVVIDSLDKTFKQFS